MGDTEFEALLERCEVGAHRSGNVLWIDWFCVPDGERGKGTGRRLWEAFEARIPDDVEVVRLMASDAGDGKSDGFWEAMGFSWAYEGEDLDYETAQEMVKGVNGHPTPLPVLVDSDEDGDVDDDDPEVSPGRRP